MLKSEDRERQTEKLEREGRPQKGRERESRARKQTKIKADSHAEQTLATPVQSNYVSRFHNNYAGDNSLAQLRMMPQHSLGGVIIDTCTAKKTIRLQVLLGARPHSSIEHRASYWGMRSVEWVQHRLRGQ